jgi:hypothetical protein
MSPLTETDRSHREQFADYACHHSEPWHKEHLDRLYALWDTFNRDYWDGRLVKPHILILEPSRPARWGDHSPISGWGSKNQIRLRPSLIRGDHPRVRAGAQFAAGRALLFDDLLLHESVHQYHDETTGLTEASYRGHGPAFAAECNRIGALLGLPPVRPAKARGKNKHLPSCAHWPFNVRPAGYYQGALIDQDQGEGDKPEPEPEPEPPTPDTFLVPNDPIEAARVIADHFRGDQSFDFATEYAGQARISFSDVDEIGVLFSPEEFVEHIQGHADPEWLAEFVALLT